MSARGWQDSESYRSYGNCRKPIQPVLAEIPVQAALRVEHGEPRWMKVSRISTKMRIVHQTSNIITLYLNIKPRTTLGGAQKRGDPFASSVSDKARPQTRWKGTEKGSKRQQLLTLPQ